MVLVARRVRNAALGHYQAGTSSVHGPERQAQLPGWLGRLGPITAVQARQLAQIASADPATHWQTILTGPFGQARAIATIPRPRSSRPARR
jgi:hypothetical protein